MPRSQTPATKRKVERVMHEVKDGDLKSASTGKPVRKRDQAIAIALSEAGVSRQKTPAQNKRTARKTRAKSPRPH